MDLERLRQHTRQDKILKFTGVPLLDVFSSLDLSGACSSDRASGEDNNIRANA